MDDLNFYLSRFRRRIHWFLIVATIISAVAVTVAFSLPPAYVSELRLLVESQQIPDELAEATATTPSAELLQIIQQRLMTRENLLRIAREHRVFSDLDRMSPDEIVLAMRAHTSIRSRVGRNLAATMTISFEASSGATAANVLNSYLSLILAEEAEIRTGRATSTLEFFEKQAEELNLELAEKNREIILFKSENADALPEALNFQFSERSNLRENIARIDSEIASLKNQREQITLVFEATGRLQGSAGASPEEQRVRQLQAELDELLVVYADQHPRVRQMQARLEQAKEALAVSSGATPEDSPAERDPNEITLGIQLAEIDTRIEALEQQRTELETAVEDLSDRIARTPANGIILDGMTREIAVLQRQYDQAVNRVSRASTGERIELASRGQRITVVEPPTVPSEPTKPNRMRLALAGVMLGVGTGGGIMFLLEFFNRKLRRPEDVMAHFQAMPIASIPYVRSRRKVIVERSLKLVFLLVILVGVPLAIYAVHLYYLPLDLLADRVMNRIGVRL